MKRRMILFIFLFFLGFSFVLTGCGKKEVEKKSDIKEEVASEGAIQVEVPPVSADGVLYGILLEKKEKDYVLQTDGGERLTFQLTEEIDISDFDKGLEPGMALRIEYKPSKKKASKKKKNFQKISPSDKLPNLSEDALVFATEVLRSFRLGDIEALSELCEYPLIYDRGTSVNIRGKKEFQNLNRKELFDEKLTNEILRTNLFMTRAYPQGFILGSSKPNIIIQNTKSGWKITAFHYQ